MGINIQNHYNKEAIMIMGDLSSRLLVGRTHANNGDLVRAKAEGTIY